MMTVRFQAAEGKSPGEISKVEGAINAPVVDATFLKMGNSVDD
jgi:hypothetical protein